MQQKTDDKIEALLNQYEKDQREFESHPLWKELGTTPKEFYVKINKVVQNSGIPPQEWKEKLNHAQKVLQTRIQENKGVYQKFNFSTLKGLRA